MTTPIPSELFKKIRHIQIETTQLANDIFAGVYRSAFKGKGMEFEEVREYQAGDEVRLIDWNVTARMNRPYVKSFREERELTVILMVDVSASSRFGSGQQSKSDIMTEIGAIIAFSAIKNNDNIGLILFSDIVEKYLPPSKGPLHALRIIRELLAFKPKHKGTDIAGALAFLGNLHRRPGVCFLLSDFLSSNYAHEASLIAKRHDLISIGITDPFEISLPPLNLLDLVDLEKGQTILADTSHQGLRKDFAELAEEHLKEHEKLMNKVGAGFIDIRTNKPYIPEIRKFFQSRGNKRR